MATGKAVRGRGKVVRLNAKQRAAIDSVNSAYRAVLELFLGSRPTPRMRISGADWYCVRLGRGSWGCYDSGAGACYESSHPGSFRDRG